MGWGGAVFGGSLRWTAPGLCGPNPFCPLPCVRRRPVGPGDKVASARYCMTTLQKQLLLRKEFDRGPGHVPPPQPRRL